MDFIPDDDDDAAQGLSQDKSTIEDAGHPKPEIGATPVPASGSVVGELQEPLLRLENNLPHVGGGRGVFAARAIAAGTLLLAEIPVAVWPDAASLDDPAVLLGAIEDVCTDAEAFEASRSLHPIMLEAADEGDRARIAGLWAVGGACEGECGGQWEAGGGEVHALCQRLGERQKLNPMESLLTNFKEISGDRAAGRRGC